MGPRRWDIAFERGRMEGSVDCVESIGKRGGEMMGNELKGAIVDGKDTTGMCSVRAVAGEMNRSGMRNVGMVFEDKGYKYVVEIRMLEISSLEEGLVEWVSPQRAGDPEDVIEELRAQLVSVRQTLKVYGKMIDDYGVWLDKSNATRDEYEKRIKELEAKGQMILGVDPGGKDKHTMVMRTAGSLAEEMAKELGI
jgi:hypothetical protein